ncbi:hypothetical protein Thiowin_01271 [Thiorhodovibrio winogradskyi]|uniref:Uncharacterized protein n=2 Tax=Thiorhodovibrio winogradskyi TaxID=77007 RepID=A0ABZ0S7S3_9GAMM
MKTTQSPNFKINDSITRFSSLALTLAAHLALAESATPPEPPAAPPPAAIEASEVVATEIEAAVQQAPVQPAPVQPPAPSDVDLATLLHGVEHQCQYNDMLERFWRSLANPEAAMRTLHPELQGAIGAIQVTDQADFRMYSIPVRGYWHKVPVSQIQFGLGKGNGIHVLLVEFASPATQATEVFEPLVNRSKLVMAQDPDNTLQATTDLIVDEGKARLICDLST